ncbi:MAG: hypothetical protein KDA96_11225 [Planctomycetaceae bacterium]|nr:hypothetical protein [Planctomycetaceae bacterium]
MNQPYPPVPFSFGWLRAVVCIVLCTSLAGCSQLVLLGYLIGGPPQIQPDFEKKTKKSFTDKDVKVAVVVYAPNELQYRFPNIDSIIANRVTQLLANNKISVIAPDQVRIWLEQNPDWDSPTEVGAAFDVTYVVYVDVSDFSLYERDSNALYRGRCDAMVKVYEMKASGNGRQIYQQDMSNVFPRETPRSATDISYDSFRTEYFWHVADQIGRLFYPYLIADEIGYAT